LTGRGVEEQEDPILLPEDARKAPGTRVPFRLRRRADRAAYVQLAQAIAQLDRPLARHHQNPDARIGPLSGGSERPGKVVQVEGKTRSLVAQYDAFSPLPP
jgi:hypothetical protein